MSKTGINLFSNSKRTFFQPLQLNFNEIPTFIQKSQMINVALNPRVNEENLETCVQGRKSP